MSLILDRGREILLLRYEAHQKSPFRMFTEVFTQKCRCSHSFFIYFLVLWNVVTRQGQQHLERNRWGVYVI